MTKQPTVPDTRADGIDPAAANQSGQPGGDLAVRAEDRR